MLSVFLRRDDLVNRDAMEHSPSPVASAQLQLSAWLRLERAQHTGPIGRRTQRCPHDIVTRRPLAGRSAPIRSVQFFLPSDDPRAPSLRMASRRQEVANVTDTRWCLISWAFAPSHTVGSTHTAPAHPAVVSPPETGEAAVLRTLGSTHFAERQQVAHDRGTIGAYHASADPGADALGNLSMLRSAAALRGVPALVAQVDETILRCAFHHNRLPQHILRKGAQLGVLVQQRFARGPQCGRRLPRQGCWLLVLDLFEQLRQARPVEWHDVLVTAQLVQDHSQSPDVAFLRIICRALCLLWREIHW
mmetsp:Transcript_27043/g.71131  ORF Transcript_27043/g.71131 Transcript_27043/m.71131 type:complete len:304 (+) Transcript_27043:1586-2497(+)